MTKSVVETGASAPAPPPMPVICDVCRKHGTAGEEGFVEIADILNFELVPRRTQVNNWTPELQRAFVAALAITGSERRAGKAIDRHEYGAQKLRKARGGRAFDEACEAELQIYREREMVRLSDQMSEVEDREPGADAEDGPEAGRQRRRRRPGI